MKQRFLFISLFSFFCCFLLIAEEPSNGETAKQRLADESQSDLSNASSNTNLANASAVEKENQIQVEELSSKEKEHERLKDETSQTDEPSSEIKEKMVVIYLVCKNNQEICDYEVLDEKEEEDQSQNHGEELDKNLDKVLDEKEEEDQSQNHGEELDKSLDEVLDEKEEEDQSEDLDKEHSEVKILKLFLKNDEFFIFEGESLYSIQGEKNFEGKTGIKKFNRGFLFDFRSYPNFSADIMEDKDIRVRWEITRNFSAELEDDVEMIWKISPHLSAELELDEEETMVSVFVSFY